MRPRLVRLVSLADVVSLVNACLGFGACVAVVSGQPGTAARLVLLAGVADGLDGLLASHTSTSDIGVEIDSLGDVVSFGVAPALLVHHVVRPVDPLLSLLPALFVVAAVLRLAAYNVEGSESSGFTGVPSTLAGVAVAVLYVADLPPVLDTPIVLLAVTLVLSFLMVTEIPYPDLRNRDALVMGGVIVAAVAVPDTFLVYVVLVGVVSFLVFAPYLY